MNGNDAFKSTREIRDRVSASLVQSRLPFCPSALGVDVTFSNNLFLAPCVCLRPWKKQEML